MRLPREIGPIHFVGIGGIGMSGIAEVLVKVDGAIRIPQAEFTSDRLASEISALAAEPARLTAMATNARNAGRLDAAERLADLLMKVAGI